MSDFMQWLYAHYIKPQLDAAPRERYAPALELLSSDLAPLDRKALAEAMEFAAVHSFLLGLRTGAGLSQITAR